MSKRWIGLLVCLLAAFVISACGGYETDKKQDAQAAEPAAEAMPSKVEVTVSEAVLVPAKTVLAEGDKLDGEEDHVIKKCPGCQFHMEGNADHAVQVADYELHFCSTECRDHFVEDAEEALVALVVPEG